MVYLPREPAPWLWSPADVWEAYEMDLATRLPTRADLWRSLLSPYHPPVSVSLVKALERR